MSSRARVAGVEYARRLERSLAFLRVRKHGLGAPLSAAIAKMSSHLRALCAVAWLFSAAPANHQDEDPLTPLEACQSCKRPGLCIDG